VRALRLAATALLLAALLPMSAPASARTPRCHGETATIIGTRGADRLVGTAGPDVIVGGDGDDVISGRGGKDVICGNVGADVLSGGPAADLLLGGDDGKGDDVAGTFLEGDLLRGGPGKDVLDGGWDDTRVDSRRVPDTFSWSDSPRGVRVDLSGSTGVATGFGRDLIQLDPRMGITGSAHADTIVGSANADRISGGDGGDQISGGGGNDEIYAESRDGTGRDTVDGGTGSDLIGSYAGPDDLRGGRGNDFIEAYGAEPATVRGDRGADQVLQSISVKSGLGSTGGPGRDVVSLYGDQLESNSPRTQFTVDLRDGTTTADLPRPPSGTIGSFEEYRLIGNLRWSFFGTAGADRVWTITGGELQARTFGGDDWVSASEHDDTINAGGGTDTVKGGKGDDVCTSAEHGTC
jgi:Ca2+-binding RTX toxin-like protein